MCRHAVVHGLGVVVPVVDDDLGLLAVVEQDLANVLATERGEVVVPRAANHYKPCGTLMRGKVAHDFGDALVG